ncbi:MAG: hypothetical protein CMJ13_02175 [Pelagibacterales bacterium]|nr:hypothetical protein [Pelagibacterales bacterium]
MKLRLIMGNKYNKVSFQGPGWDHFRARDLHRKKLDKVNNTDEKLKPTNKKDKTAFSWLMDTVNPLNHLPIVSSVKKLITESNKSLDIIQSAVGGFLFAGPLGVLKGIGGWAANKMTDNFFSINSNEVTEEKGLELKSKKPENQVERNEIISDKMSHNINRTSMNKNNKFSFNILHYTNSNIKNTNILEKKIISNKVIENYSEVETLKNKINISA